MNEPNILAQAVDQLIQVIDQDNKDNPADSFGIRKIVVEVDYSGNPWRDPNNNWVVKAYDWNNRVYGIAIFVNIEQNTAIADGY